MKKAISTFFTVAFVCAFSSLVFPAAYTERYDQPDPWRYRPGLRNSCGSHGLGATQLRLLLDSLRHKTGWLEMRFDEAGFLTLGDRTHIAGGSASARELLRATVDGQQAFELEVYDHSPEIAFARITANTVRSSAQTGAWIESQQVQLDFADFAALRGDRAAVAAFDPGFAVLHELVHGVLHLHDAVGERNQLGACDEQINRMRRDLGLPERTGYSPRVQELMSRSGNNWMQAKMLFVAHARTESGHDSTQRFYLCWVVAQVGTGETQAGAPMIAALR